ncbi:unnamed protein product [Vicia faba]|uniref:Uncharacterized protein n=1 Tax=Vicia faba TaxID=3906 RepID=A0AAV0YXM4_VICFA|nr:unnamed protein product [Vicia faba]
MPDYYLDKAIKTGLFDYVFVQFYNNPPCQYNIATSDATLLLQSWNAWTSLVLPNNTVFLGLPASPNAAPSGGYIPPIDLITKIKVYLIKSALQFVTQVSEAIAASVSTALNALLPN